MAATHSGHLGRDPGPGGSTAPSSRSRPRSSSSGSQPGACTRHTVRVSPVCPSLSPSTRLGSSRRRPRWRSRTGSARSSDWAAPIASRTATPYPTIRRGTLRYGSDLGRRECRPASDGARHPLLHRAGSVGCLCIGAPRPVIEGINDSPPSNSWYGEGGLVCGAAAGRVESGSCPKRDAVVSWRGANAAQCSLTGQRDRGPAFTVTRWGRPCAVERCDKCCGSRHTLTYLSVRSGNPG